MTQTWTAGISDLKYVHQYGQLHPPSSRRKPYARTPVKTATNKEKPKSLVVSEEVTVKQIYQYIICGTTMQSLASYNRHSDSHKGNFKHTCSICQKGFMSSADFTGHMAKHTNLKEYDCVICGKKFAYHTSLNRHMRMVHTVK